MVAVAKQAAHTGRSTLPGRPQHPLAVRAQRKPSAELPVAIDAACKFSSLLNVATRSAALLEIFLMILFGSIKLTRRREFCGNRPLEFSAGVQRGNGCLSFRLLLRRMKQYRGAILFAKVRPLPIHLRRVVHAPERIRSEEHTSELQ